MHDSVWLWRWLAMFAIQNELIFAKPNCVAGTWWILGWVEQYNVGCLHFSLFYCPVKFTAPRFLISFTFVSGFHLSCRTYPPIYSKVSPTNIDSLKVWICTSKHFQRHNGITAFKLCNKLVQIQLQNRHQTSASKYQPKVGLKMLTSL